MPKCKTFMEGTSKWYGGGEHRSLLLNQDSFRLELHEKISRLRFHSNDLTLL